MWATLMKCARFRLEEAKSFSAAVRFGLKSRGVSPEASTVDLGLVDDSRVHCSSGEKVFAYYAGSIQVEQRYVACEPEMAECWFPGYLDEVSFNGTWGHVTWVDND